MTPTKERYTFGGWYTDNVTFESAWDFNTAVTGDITLYARWAKVSANPTESTNPTSTTDDSNLSTGDYNNIALWLLILLFSLGMIVTVLYFIFRNKVKK